MKKISIVGVEGSGKTVLMSVLGDAYSSPDANGLFLNPVNRETFEYCTKTVAEMRQGFWPDVTEPGKTVTLQWRLGKINAGKLSTELCEVTMMDFAGEVYRQAFADNPLNESTQEDVRGLREYISECDGLLLLINLKDVIDGNRAEQRTIDMLWTSKSILDYAAENGVRGVAIAFTQADRYTSIIEECGGLSGVLKKHFPLIGAVYPDIRLFAVSAVGQTVLDEKRNEVPAEDFVSSGFEDVMAWMSKSSSEGGSMPEKAEETHASREIVGALKVVFWSLIFFVSLYNALRQDESTSAEVWMWVSLIIGASFFFFRLLTGKVRSSGDGDGRVLREKTSRGERKKKDGVQLWKNGPYWADRNIGAERPEDYGYYFWWGDTVGYKYVNDKWVASNGSKSDFLFEDGNTRTYDKVVSILQSKGWLTNDGMLALKHDAARAHWGGNWRMPTKQELEDLKDKCDWEWTAMNGVNGYRVSGKGAYASASIFLPAAGRGYGTSLGYAGSNGYYWSSVPASDSNYAWYLYFNSGDHRVSYYSRYYGRSVRAVQGFTK